MKGRFAGKRAFAPRHWLDPMRCAPAAAKEGGGVQCLDAAGGLDLGHRPLGGNGHGGEILESYPAGSKTGACFNNTRHPQIM